MKKLIVLNSFLALLLSSVFAYAQQAGTVSSQVSIKSPWSGIAFVETERNAVGTPQKGFSNLMFVEVGRSILGDVIPGLSLAGRLYGSNKFATDEAKDG